MRTLGNSPSLKEWEPVLSPVGDPLPLNNRRTSPLKKGILTPTIKKPTIALDEKPFVFSSPKPRTELDDAATKVQKVYKSYRTRRNLADCAVVVEELWWKAYDSMRLEKLSVNFFEMNKKETPASRWTRAKTRLAKVGKGLSEDEKAQKLALQHWLEAIDARHRYGHNLHLYYDLWTESKSKEPFFYWLDVGSGKEVVHVKCSRAVLQRQCIKYLEPSERRQYEVIVDDGKLVYRQDGRLLETTEGSKWIFVLSTSKALYVGQKKKGEFQHSSFLSGAAITAAGRLIAHGGILEAVWPYSGHYLPTEDNFNEFISFLESHNVDLSNVKKHAMDDDDASSKMSRKSSDLEEVDDGAATAISSIEHPHEAGNAVAGLPLLDVAVRNPLELFGTPKRLSCNWSSGVGPRIGCVRDYPQELQSMALEQVNLSPRVTPGRFHPSLPIPSPRPSPKIRVSPRLAYMGLPSPRVPVSSS